MYACVVCVSLAFERLVTWLLAKVIIIIIMNVTNASMCCIYMLGRMGWWEMVVILTSIVTKVDAIFAMEIVKW